MIEDLSARVERPILRIARERPYDKPSLPGAERVERRTAATQVRDEDAARLSVCSPAKSHIEPAGGYKHGVD